MNNDNVLVWNCVGICIRSYRWWGVNVRQPNNNAPSPQSSFSFCYPNSRSSKFRLLVGKKEKTGLTINPASPGMGVCVWTLILMTYAGVMSEPHTFATKRLCLEAESIARYGLTIDEKATADSVEGFRKRDFTIKFKPRKPKTALEKSLTIPTNEPIYEPQTRIADNIFMWYSYTDSLIHFSRGDRDKQSRSNHPSDIKYSKCIRSE